MEHRSYGETKDCNGCRSWSEMVAFSNGGGPVQAMCLDTTSPKHGRYTKAIDTCDAWKSGELGAIDEPGADPLRYQKKVILLNPSCAWPFPAPKETT